MFKTNLFPKVVKLLEIMTKSRSRSRSKSRDRTRRSKHRKRSRSQSRPRKMEKQHSSRVTSSRKEVSETKYRFVIPDTSLNLYVFLMFCFVCSGKEGHGLHPRPTVIPMEPQDGTDTAAATNSAKLKGSLKWKDREQLRMQD